MSIRKLCFGLVAVSLLAVPSLQAKSSGQTRFERHPWHKAVDAKTQSVSGNIGGLGWGSVDINYEKALGDKNSWLVGADLGFRGYTGWSYSAIGAHGAYRWWWLEDRPLQGIFAGPRAGFIMYNYTYDTIASTPPYAKVTESLGATGFLLGGEGGYQWIFNNGLTLRAGGELNYVIGSVSSKTGGPALTGFGLVPNYVAAIGYSW